MGRKGTVFASCNALVHQVITDRVASGWLIVLLAINAALLALHGVHSMTGSLGPGVSLDDPVFSLDSNVSLAQLFSSSQTLILAALLLALARRCREAVYLALAIVFLLVMLDDTMELHRMLGRQVLQVTPLPALPGYPSIEPQDLAELVSYGLLAIPVLGLLILLLRAAPARHRAAGLAFLLLLGVLGFFAIAIDLIHMAVEGAFAGAGTVFEMLEEGGEMLSVSLALVLAIALYRSEAPLPATPAL